MPTAEGNHCPCLCFTLLTLQQGEWIQGESLGTGSQLGSSWMNRLVMTLWTVAPPGSSVHGILQARVLELDSLFLLQGIFPTQGSNPSIPHCRLILYCLSHQGSPRRLEWVAYPFSSRSF